MRIKKILASVLAAAIAVSATAISVSAASYPVEATGDNFQTTVTASVTDDIIVGKSIDVVLTQGDPAYGIINYSIVVDYFNKKDDMKTITFNSGDIYSWGEAQKKTFTTSEGAAFADLVSMGTNTSVKITVTALVQAAEMKKGATGGIDVTITTKDGSDDPVEMLTGLAKATADSTKLPWTGAAKSPVNLSTYFKRAQQRELADGATLNFTVEKAPATPGYITVTLKGAANEAKDATLFAAISGTTASVKIPAGFTAYLDDTVWEYASAATIEFAVLAGLKDADDGDVKIGSIELVTEEPEDTTEATTEETTEETTAETTADTSATADDIDEPADTGAAALVVAPAIISAIATIISKKRK